MNSPSVVIRAALLTDAPAITAIFNDAILHTTAIYAYDPVPISDREKYLVDRGSQGFPVLVATLDDAVVGYASYGPFRTFPAYKFTCENSLYVRSDIRGKGIGKALLQATIDAATGAGMHTMIAAVDASNDVSIGVHQQFGFERTAVIRQVGYKFNRWLDLLLMQKML